MSAMGISAVAFDRIAQIRRLMGPPAWEGPGVLVYEGDCQKLLPRLPDECIDLTATSPPYNIGKEYEEARPLEDYLSWCESWMEQVFRATQPSGAFWLNLGYMSVPGRGKAVPIPYLLWQRTRFFLLQEVVWNYGAGVAARKMFSPRNEKWLWYLKTPDSYTFNLDAVRDPDVKYPNQKKNGRVRVNNLGKNPTDVWQVPKVTTGAGRTGQRASPERTAHPAQFPEAVLRRIILASSDPGDLVLDPFVGSGTTAVVALATGRACIGIELSSPYVNVAVRRLERTLRRQSVKQPSLFE